VLKGFFEIKAIFLNFELYYLEFFFCSVEIKDLFNSETIADNIEKKIIASKVGVSK
jgi:hypothetical protein